MARTIPLKDSDFDDKQAVITNKTAQKLTDWNINNGWFNGRLMPAKNAWTVAWTAYQNPATRTTVIVFNKNEARKVYQPLLSTLAEILKSNPLVTPADLEEMGIVVNKGRGSNTNRPPETYPDFDIDSSVIRRLKVAFRDQGSTSRAKPHGVHGAEIRWCILDAPPKDISDLRNSSFDTHSPFTLEFSEVDRGKTVYFCLRWESTTGEKGPWSEIISAIIP
ncbi:MAG: hypothetical protein LBC40_09100 [Dysgonamonadaceae bacterium]|jgi:hypothetical protein|nr:hypothetical protein [Dysgonamonadaceae bacterium]